MPKELIAYELAKPKDSAKLLVYNRNTDTITHTTFKNILDFIPKDTHIFLNDTKVIKARVYGNKLSGAKMEVFLNYPLQKNKFLVQIRGKVKIGTLILFDNDISVKVLNLNEDGTRVVRFYKKEKELEVTQLYKELKTIGHTPLPPYIKRDDTKDDVTSYQSLFAKYEGAVAAPTASLHFTKELFKDLEKKFPTNYLTLHVSAGTFKGVEVEDIKQHNIHSEFFNIPNSSKQIIDDKSKNILTIGTTSTRVVEFYVREKKINGACNLFLNPDNKPLRVNHLLTNFHLPKSTLIMLVSSFVGREKTLFLYKEAIQNNYKFYSYGDAMLII